MSNFEDSIAHKAHGLVHGDRAKDYGHPRFDFTAIGKVWTGLMQDLLKDGATIDPYRVAVLMTGLKLCRLVKSPGHHDSRVDTIGYMLTMERLDEPEDDWVERKGFPPGTFSRPCGDECPEPEGTPCCEPDPQPRANTLTFSQVSVWFEPKESKWINGQEHINTEECGKLIVFPFAPGTDVTISPHPPRDVVCNPLTGKPLKPGEVVADLGVKPVHTKDVITDDPRSEIEKLYEKDNIERVKRIHSHEFEAPCIPGCPVWDIENKHRPMFEFTGEQVKMERPDTRPGGGL